MVQIAKDFMTWAIAREVSDAIAIDPIVSASDCANVIAAKYPSWDLDRNAVINAVIKIASDKHAAIWIGR